MKKLYHTIFDPVLKCSVAPIQMSEPSQFLMMRSRAELGGGGGGGRGGTFFFLRDSSTSRPKGSPFVLF